MLIASDTVHRLLQGDCEGGVVLARGVDRERERERARERERGRVGGWQGGMERGGKQQLHADKEDADGACSHSAIIAKEDRGNNQSGLT